MTSFSHIPVFKQRCIDLLAPAIENDGAVLVDATLGLGGHTEAALERFPNLRVIGIDRDLDALEHSRVRLAAYTSRVEFVHAVYDELPEVLADLAIPTVQGILFDLGVSSMQLDNVQRGFSYSQSAPLDMRMNPTVGNTAADVVNTYSHGELARILSTYGEERFASRIASAIIREREIAPFTNSERLVAVVRDAIPAATRRTGGNPAKRTFQALRIEVNDELSVLSRAIPAAIEALAIGGRLVVLSYQSLEDRIVKQAFREVTQTKIPVDLPFIPAGQKPKLQLLTKGAQLATEEEIAQNTRAASVRLRAIERLAA